MQRIVEVPPRITPADDRGYFEEITKAIFRSGFSWRVISQKWDSFRGAFDGFDIEKVAGYGPDDAERLPTDSGIVRNRRKIAATIDNARTMLTLAAEHGSFAGYLRSLDGVDYRQRVKALTGQFAGLGPTGTFVFLHCVNEETADWHDR